jgi:hypothetical protein
MSLTTDKLFDKLVLAYPYTTESKTRSDWSGKTLWKGRVVKFHLTGFETPSMNASSVYNGIFTQLGNLITDSTIRNPLERKILLELTDVASERDMPNLAQLLIEYDQMLKDCELITKLRLENLAAIDKLEAEFKKEPEQPLAIQKLFDKIQEIKNKKKNTFILDCKRYLDKIEKLKNEPELLEKRNQEILAKANKGLDILFNSHLNALRDVPFVFRITSKKAMKFRFDSAKWLDTCFQTKAAFEISSDDLINSITTAITTLNNGKYSENDLYAELKKLQVTLEVHTGDTRNNAEKFKGRAWHPKKQTRRMTKSINLWHSKQMSEPVENKRKNPSKPVKNVRFIKDVYLDRYNKLHAFYDYLIKIGCPKDQLDLLELRLKSFKAELSKKPLNVEAIDSLEEATILDITSERAFNKYLFHPAIKAAVYKFIVQKRNPRLYPGVAMYDQQGFDGNLSELSRQSQWLKLVKIVTQYDPQLLK